MSISHAERRQIENEMIFRRINEKVGDDLVALDAMHIDDGNIDLISSEDTPLRFKCECSDENCSERITLELSEYQEIHADRSVFIVQPGHQVRSIEKVIKQLPTYNIVKKHHITAEPSDTLKVTSINNS